MGAGVRRPKGLVPGRIWQDRWSRSAEVTRFQPGDAVFVRASPQTVASWGAFAEYAAVPPSRFEPKPPGLTFEQAAAVPTSGSLAVQGVRDEGRVQAGQRVLINGAGEVGTFAVQLAKAYGAEVIVWTLPRSSRCSGRSGRIGSWTTRKRTSRGAASDNDVILDIAGNHPWPDIERTITPDGAFVLIGHDHYGASGHRWFGESRSLRQAARDVTVREPAAPFPWREGPGRSLVVMKELIEAGKVWPVVDRAFPLSQVPDAMRYLESGKPWGRSSSRSVTDDTVWRV
jgi:NADPH:quinone reductase-like Zn-dependent oxidoreductase